jgi:RNA polymerase sigma-70 factor (ECF subfamily)
MGPLSSPGTDLPTGQMSFHTTHWSVVLAAREQDDATLARQALGTLCSTYWYPLYAFVRRQGFGPHEAQDLAQEFFYQFLERHALKHVRPEAGKFRSFLLTCLKNFLVNQRERAQAQRRGSGQPVLSLDGASAETQYSLEPADRVTPELLFDRRWAMNVLDQALKALERDYAKRGQSDLFAALRGFLPSARGSESRAEVAAKHGMSPGALDVAVHRLRQRFGSMLREQVAQTVSSEGQVEEEIRYLISVLGS